MVGKTQVKNGLQVARAGGSRRQAAGGASSSASRPLGCSDPRQQLITHACETAVSRRRPACAEGGWFFRGRTRPLPWAVCSHLRAVLGVSAESCEPVTVAIARQRRRWEQPSGTVSAGSSPAMLKRSTKCTPIRQTKKSKQCSKVVDFLLHEGCSAFSPSVGSEASDITVGPGNPQMKEKGKGSACMHVPAFFLIPASKVPPRQSLLPAFSASLSALVSAKHPAQCRARRRRGELVARAPASTFPPQSVTNSLWSLWSLSQVVRSKDSWLLGECSCARRVATLLHALTPCVATSAAPPLLIPHRRLLPPPSRALSGLSSRQICGGGGRSADVRASATGPASASQVGSKGCGGVGGCLARGVEAACAGPAASKGCC